MALGQRVFVTFCLLIRQPDGPRRHPRPRANGRHASALRHPAAIPPAPSGTPRLDRHPLPLASSCRARRHELVCPAAVGLASTNRAVCHVGDVARSRRFCAASEPMGQYDEMSRPTQPMPIWNISSATWRSRSTIVAAYAPSSACPCSSQRGPGAVHPLNAAVASIAIPRTRRLSDRIPPWRNDAGAGTDANGNSLGFSCVVLVLSCAPD